MKIVGKSNFDIESMADCLVADNVPSIFAETLCAAMNAKFSGEDELYYFHVKSDDYKLWRGMEDLV